MFSTLPSRIACSYAIAALFMVLTSCSKQKEAFTSTLTGTVVLHDEFGYALNDNSGVTVSLYEDASVKTSTAADGSFSLSGIPMGKYVLKAEKQVPPIFYGTYFTRIAITASTGTIAKPINLGQITDLSEVKYDWSYTLNPSKGYIIFRGTRRQSSATDTWKRAHRLFFKFSVSDVYPNLYSSRYSIGPIQNNLPNGFSDTVSINKLLAARIGTFPSAAIAADNPRADSCIIPSVDYNINGQPIYYPNIFINTYPAISLPASIYGGDLFTDIKLD